MRGLLKIQGHTHSPRHLVLSAATDALNDAGVMLEDIQQFSNRMTLYRFELDPAELAALVSRLETSGVVLDGTRPAEAIADIDRDDDGWVRAALQITFPSEDGDQRNPNPDLG